MDYYLTASYTYKTFIEKVSLKIKFSKLQQNVEEYMNKLHFAIENVCAKKHNMAEYKIFLILAVKLEQKRRKLI